MTTTRERPIIFSGPMVRAILGGRKTQTRRVVPIGWRGSRAGIEFVGGRGMEDDPESWGYADEYGDYYTLANDNSQRRIPCPYGEPGDRLWVRETWSYFGGDEYLYLHDRNSVLYRADVMDFDMPAGGRWRPSIHMPRWASRLLLEITQVRVERLQEISEEDARAEGLPLEGLILPGHAAGIFGRGWDEIHGAGAWAANPWVWVVNFRSLAEQAAATPEACA